METKICTKCKIKKYFSEFYKGNDKNGLSYMCKQCYNQYNLDNALRISKQKKQYHKYNADKEKQYQKNNIEIITRQRKQHNRSASLFRSYYKKLESFEKIRRCPQNNKLLEVRCAYCGKWMKPTNLQVRSRIQAFNGTISGEQRFYCSDNCKRACPIYKQHKYPKGFKQATSREVVPLLRQLVLERDNWTCQKCGATTETAQLHVHHIIPYAQNKMQANDPDNCITFCKSCHKEVHSQYGCRYIDLTC